MSSRDTGTPLSRFETCVQCLLQILRQQVRECDHVGVVCFGPGVHVVIAPTLKGRGGAALEAQIAALRPQQGGGTRFFDAMASCLQLLGQPTQGMGPEVPRWLVCLTDGDDLGSGPQNMRGQIVSHILAASPPSNLNMVTVTVGPIKPVNIQVIESWIQRVTALGGVGRLLSERNAATIAKAFEVVAEYLAVEVGGVVEC